LQPIALILTEALRLLIELRDRFGAPSPRLPPARHLPGHRGRGRAIMRRALAAGSAGALSLLAGPVAAGEAAAPAPAPAVRDWQFSIAPYLWVIDVVADYSFREFSGHAEPHVKDLLSNLELGAMGTFEVFHAPSRLFLNVDAFWLRVSSESDAGPFDVGAGPFTFQSPGLQRQVGPVTIQTRQGPLTLGPFDVDTGPVRVDVPRVEFAVGPFDIEQTGTQSAVRASLGWRALDVPLASAFGQEPGEDDPRRLRGDVYVGARTWYLKAEIEVDYPPIEVPGLTIRPSLPAYPRLMLGDVTVSGVTFGGNEVRGSESTWWVDPLVGIRLGADLCGSLGLVLNGNVGGFGIGSASQWSWEALAFLTWRLGEHWTAAAGYRGLAIDRRNGDIEGDLIMHGPALGIIYSF
jgi:hypothetical protein